VIRVAFAAALLLALPANAYAARAQTHDVVARVRLAPQSVLFGDVVTATVDVVVDRTRVDPDDVTVRTTLRPYRQLGRVVRTRTDVGNLTELRTTTRLDCLEPRCARPSARLRIKFPPALVFYRPRSGGAVRRVNIRWPPLVVDSRLDAQAVAQSKLLAFGAPWRADVATMPRVSYRADPALLEWGLLAAGLVLLAGGAGLVAVGVGRGGALSTLLARRSRPLPPLEHALAQVELARRDGSAERRRALELLARELRSSGAHELALDARELAWAEPGPDDGLTVELADRVRQFIGARRNGA
jgi:hypothetical protein